jgi:hypothetical protein
LFQLFARLPHHGPHQTVGQEPGLKSLAGHGGLAHGQHVQFQLRFDLAEIQFGLPALAIPAHEQLDGLVALGKGVNSHKSIRRRSRCNRT